MRHSLCSVLTLAGTFSLVSGAAAQTSTIGLDAAAQDADVLRPAYAAAWKAQTHPDLAAFNAWTRKLPAAGLSSGAASPSLATVSEGVQLAKERRAVLLKLMRTDPARALAAGIPAAVRAKLPAVVARELETPFSALGDYIVAGQLSAPGGKTLPSIMRKITLADGRSYEAHVYGRRLALSTERKVFLQGIILDGEAALEDSVSRVPTAEEEVSKGNKQVLVIRVDFSDLAGEPGSLADVQSVADTQVKPFYTRSSYGLASLTNTVTPRVYRLPRTAASYAAAGDNDGLHSDARDAAATDFDVNAYDRVVVVFAGLQDQPGSKIQYASLGLIGGKDVWVNGEFNFGVVARALGHTFGLRDTSLGETAGGKSLASAGADFNASAKTQLGWLTTANVQTVKKSGTYRVSRFDGGSANGVVALKIVKDGLRDYWVSVRRNAVGDHAVTHGIDVNLEADGAGSSQVSLNLRDPVGSRLARAALPTGHTFTDAAARVSVTAVSEGGTSPDEYEDVQIVLADADAPPVVNSPSTTTAYANSGFTYQITATNTPTSYGVANLPPGLSIDTATGLITGTPRVAGIYNVVIAATNSQGKGFSTVVITVYGSNGVPIVLSGPTSRAYIGKPFSYQIIAVNSPETFDAIVLPDGLTIDKDTGRISGTVNEESVRLITLAATNATGTGTATLTLFIGAAPGPSFNDNFANPQLLLGSAASLPNNNTAATKEAGEPPHAGDAGGRSLWYSWTAPATGPVVFDTQGSTFDTLLAVYTGNDLSNLIPIGSDDDFSYYGKLSRVDFQAQKGITYFVAVDGFGGDSGLVSLQYDQPTGVSVPVISSALTVAGQAGNEFNYRITATNTPISFAAIGLPSGLSIDSTSGIISGMPEAMGTFSVTLAARNNNGQSTATLSLTIAAVPPTIASAKTATGQAGVAFTYQIEASGTPTSFAALGLPAGLSIDTATGLISGTPATSGNFNVTLEATNLGGTGKATLALTVKAATPVITSGLASTAAMGTAFSYQITATSQPTSFAASGLPAGLGVNTGTGVISGVPTAQGVFTVAISATNSVGTGKATLQLTVNAPGTPVITSPLTATGKAATAFTYQIAATNAPASYAATGLPAGLGINAATGLISGTPAAAGTYSVTIKAVGNGGTGSAVLVLTIKPSTPVIDAVLTIDAQEDVVFSYQITATNNPTSFTATGLPDGLSLDATTGIISGTPTTPGVYSVVIQAANSVGADTQTLEIRINQAGTPVITSALAASSPVGVAFTYQIAATNNPTSFAAGGLPAGIAVNTATGVLAGTPTAAGIYQVAIQAKNSFGTATQTLVLTVSTVPTVSFVVPGANGGKNAQLLEGAAPLRLRVVRDGGDISQPLIVQYKIKGGNTPGVDYKMLSGTVTIPAGAAGAKIKVRAFDDGIADGNKTLRLKLLPGAGGSYVLGTPLQAKIRIIDLQSVAP